MNRQMTLVTLAAAAVALALSATARATVLNFDFAGSGSLGGIESTYQTYGDAVTAVTAPGPGTTYTYGMGNGWTPNVQTAYSHAAPAFGHSLSNDPSFVAGYVGDHVDYLAFHDNSEFWFTFTPDANYRVTVNSFLIEVYNSGPAPTLTWRLRRDSTTGAVFASGVETVANAQDKLVTTGAEFYTGTVVLELIYTGTGNYGNVAVDDINFDQYLPEPTSAAMISLGAACLLRRRRRARTSDV